MNDLKPCPFCGSRRLHIYALDNGVRCCDCSAKIVDVPDWRERWNRRTDDCPVRILTCEECAYRKARTTDPGAKAMCEWCANYNGVD